MNESLLHRHRLYVDNKYITLLILKFNDFFQYMEENHSFRLEFEQNMKKDYDRIKSTPPNSILKMWKKNLHKKMYFCLLVYKKHYVGSCRILPMKYKNENKKHDFLKNSLFVSVIYIAPRFRKIGLASKMISIISKKHAIILYVNLNNSPALKLYKKLGFEIIEKDDDYYKMFKCKSN